MSRSDSKPGARWGGGPGAGRQPGRGGSGSAAGGRGNQQSKPSAEQQQNSKWTPGIDKAGILALYAKSDNTLDPTKLHEVLLSWVPEINARFSPELRHLADPNGRAWEEYPPVEGLREAEEPPEEPLPADPNAPTAEERAATREYRKLFVLWEAKTKEIAASNERKEQASVTDRKKLYAFAHGQCEPRVLNIMRSIEAGKTAQEPVNLCPLLFFKALKSFSTGRPQQGTESQWDTAQ
jgi:hypothetical protein